MRGFLGSLLILSGGAMGMFLQTRERRRRRETLQNLISALRRMEEEIRLMRTPLPRLLLGLSAETPGEAGAFLSRTADGIRRGEAPGTVWRREAETLPLKEQDRAALRALNFQGDETALCGAVALLVRQLLRSREEGEREETQEAKRSAALWASGAALLVILLI